MTETLKSTSTEKVKDWFDELISILRTDQIMLETKTAPEKTNNLYNTFIFGDEAEIVESTRAASSLYFVKNLVFDYLKELKAYNRRPVKLALDLSDAKILVWAEINEDDEETEDALILAEAKANAKYSKHGFHISSTIVETCDRLSIPPHYKLISA